MSSDPFGIRWRFVGLRNFANLFPDAYYWSSVRLSLVFSAQVAFLAMAAGLLLAVMANRPFPQIKTYKILLI